MTCTFPAFNLSILQQFYITLITSILKHNLGTARIMPHRRIYINLKGPAEAQIGRDLNLCRSETDVAPLPPIIVCRLKWEKPARPVFGPKGGYATCVFSKNHHPYIPRSEILSDGRKQRPRATFPYAVRLINTTELKWYVGTFMWP